MSKSKATLCYIGAKQLVNENYKAFCKAANSNVANCLKFRDVVLPSSTVEDLVDDTVEVAVRYFLDNYSPSKGCKPTTFIYACCRLSARNRVNKYVAEMNKEIPNSNLNPTYTQGEFIGMELSIPCAANAVDAKDMVERIKRMFKNDKVMTKLIEFKLEGMTFSGISKKMGKGFARQAYGSQWYRRIQRIRDYFEKVRGLSSQDVLGKPYRARSYVSFN